MSDTPHPIILSLDLGTKTGWALWSKNSRILSGTAHFRPRRFEGGGMRYLRFERWLAETRNICGGIDAVYFEEVRRHSGVDAAHAYGGFLASLTAWCEELTIPYEGVPVGTIKKFITGKGNAGKQAVIDAVKALGHHPEDDNEADALALLHYAREQYQAGRNV
jgi:Holliday junction resolvasome RuvABC endonuclease subunit